MAHDPVYIVAGSRPWNKEVFDSVIRHYPGTWHYIAGREELTDDLLREHDPDFVFFLHWSWIVPADVVERWECVCFHMTDVPYGRGGSPLQNLIVRGHRSTRMTALRMEMNVDAGPVYLKRDLSLEGSAEEVYLRATHLSAQMMLEIIESRPVPQVQRGEPTIFNRRTPAASKLPAVALLAEVFDFIRMLDADGYPRAFIDYGDFRLEFSRPALRSGRVEADVTIHLRPGPPV